MSVVSVIIPVYNNEVFVEKCIRSVMEQTYTSLEIIVINDGSTDNSLAILKELETEDSRIRLINQKNAGVSAARNRGLEIATGEYLTFVDGDDYIGPDYIKKLYISAKKQNAEMIICGLKYVDESGRVLRELKPGGYKRYEKEEWTFRISSVCSHFYLRELWIKNQVQFCLGERGEDMPISLFFSAVCDKIAILQDVEYYYVQHQSSAMHNFKGLRSYRLPYHALEQTVKKIQEIGVANSCEFYELFVLRIMCTCFFELARGASRENMRELCDYIVRILEQYFPMYYKNRLTGLFVKIDVPFIQKIAVKILIVLVRTKMIYPFSRLLSV